MVVVHVLRDCVPHAWNIAIGLGFVLFFLIPVVFFHSPTILPMPPWPGLPVVATSESEKRQNSFNNLSRLMFDSLPGTSTRFA